MKRSRVILGVWSVLLGVCLMAAISSASVAEEETGYYLFSHFIGNGEDGLHFAASRDGLHWTECRDGKSFMAPIPDEHKSLVRDPSICLGPDGLWHCVWTVAWDGKHIGHAVSRDLVTWTDQTLIPVMAHEPTTRNSWAPEIFYDDATDQYYIIWSSTIPGRFSPDGTSEDHYDHRAYFTTTKDFKNYAPTKLYFDPGYNIIDSFLFKKDGVYYLFYKDERLNPEKKVINLATGPTAEGPWTFVETISTHNWVEGPSVLPMGDEIYIFYDCYVKNCYGGVATRDFKTWTDIESEIIFPKDIRHGTAFEVDRETYERVVGIQ